MIALPVWFWKLVAATVLLAGVAGMTWFAADAHYTKQYTALKAQYEQAAKDEKAKNDATIATDKAAAKEVNDEAQAQIASMSAAIADLRVRINAGRSALRVCPAPASAAGPAQPANGSAAGAGSGAAAAAQGTGSEIAIDAGVLGDTLDTAIAAITAELQWRQYARETGQGK